MSNSRLLFVDHEPSVLASYADSLTRAGFQVTQASDGAEAMRQIESDRFDVIFSDLSAPKIDGLALLRRLRIRFPELPVILMLDAPDDRAATKGIQLGAFRSLVKPIAVELLAQTASDAVRLGRSRRHTTDYPGERPEPVSVSATDAKNVFGRILEKAIQGGRVVITKHDVPKAVLISVDEFDALSRASRVHLDTLSGEFDALLLRMQTPAARAGMQAAFDASPNQLGQAAVAAARQRG
jgi:prevent-host-death family protein